MNWIYLWAFGVDGRCDMIRFASAVLVELTFSYSPWVPTKVQVIVAVIVSDKYELLKGIELQVDLRLLLMVVRSDLSVFRCWIHLDSFRL